MKTLVIVAVFFAFSAQVAQAVCNSEDGNVPAWTNVNYTGVLYGEIPVCRVGSNVPVAVVQQGRDGWNGAAGKTLLTSACPQYVGVVVVDVPDGECGWSPDNNGDTLPEPNPACADMPTQEGPELLFLKTASVYTTYSDVYKKHVLSHELGHTLGFFHLEGICDSVMSVEDCAYDRPGPTALDYANYYEAYVVEAVTDLQGWSTTPADAWLAWDAVNAQGEELCNEAGFSVIRNGSEVASVEQDVTTAVLSDQPYGPQGYRVRSLTEAIARAPAEAETVVDVFGPLVKSNFLFGPSPANLSDEQGRYLWSIGEVRNPESVSLDVEVRSSVTGRPSGCSQLDQLILPGSEQFRLAPGEIKWVLHRHRWECHSPAHAGVYPMPAQLCVRESSQTIEDCRGSTRPLIVQ